MSEIITKQMAEAARLRLGDKRAAELEALMAGVIEGLAPTVRQLRMRLDALEEQAMVYRGVWRDTGAQFTNGDLVTHAGCLWFCRVTTKARPGNSADWTMMTKSGKQR